MGFATDRSPSSLRRERSVPQYYIDTISKQFYGIAMRYAATLLMCLSVVACTTTPKRSTPTSVTHSTTSDAPKRSGNAAGGTEVAALIDGHTVKWSTLRPLLVEASGGEILGEWILDRRVEAELRKRRMAVSESDVQREKVLMQEQLSTNADQAIRLLSEVRDKRGLGPRRFEALLRRNAGLRKLIADDVKVSESMIRSAYEQTYGEKIICRLILVDKLVEANRVIRRLEAGESFTDLAIEVSTDESHRQGGLLPPISPYDPTFPKEIRNAAVELQPGQRSVPVALESGFAILQCERRVREDATAYEQVKDDMRRIARLQLERTLMHRQARVLLSDLDVTILDADLNRAWEARRSRLLEP